MVEPALKIEAADHLQSGKRYVITVDAHEEVYFQGDQVIEALFSYGITGKEAFDMLALATAQMGRN